MTNETKDFAQWIGRTDIVEDDLSPATMQAAACTLDETTMREVSSATELPPLWQWF